MNINSLEFPYPVLSSYSEDYLNSEFDVEYNLENKGFTTQSLIAKFNIENKTIESYLERGIFGILLHIECPQTSYRRVYKVDNNIRSIDIPIDTKKLRSKVELSSFIVSNVDLKKYTNKNINMDIYGQNYCINNLKKGNIVAATYTQTMSIEIENDDFQKFSSIIKVGQSKDKFLEVDLDGDLIVILLPKKEYIQYVQLSNTVYSDIIVTSIIYPSLVYVLEQLTDSNKIPIYRDLTWFKVIEDKLSLKEIRIEDINERYSTLKLAQMILESPIERGLDSIKQELEREDY